ncbi:MAG: ATP-dependent zinc metalloprotease FtsH [bacterium]|nr:ATP-dependent zinc metalloprotease FtsH [bacterium]
MIIFVAVRFLSAPQADRAEITYSEMLAQLSSDNISEVTFVEREVRGKFKAKYLPESAKGRTEGVANFLVRIPFADTDLVDKFSEAGVKISAEKSDDGWIGYLITLAPFLLIILLWVFIMRQMQGGGPKGLFSFGKSKAKLMSEDRPKVTFNDVAGADEAKEELAEIIEFLKEPGKFQKLGGKIPKGALLVGPPGTGKTLLARAVAGEAGVPFFSMSGSDFVEMFVGVGASRVRDLFDQGKKNAPCIIFIDEIDAVGRLRGAGLGGGHDEREQTLNQLLVEMDGFESNEGVILVAATNRPDVLDPALLRPGRFDRQIIVNLPDVKGREGILLVHTKKINMSDDVELKLIARGTPGMSGADLANVVNEAALLAARRNGDKVTMRDFEQAKDKVMMGAERRSLVISEEEKRTTAYHEAGHALVGKLIPKADPVYKVTIIPRGLALGVTSFLPTEEKHTYSKEYLETKLIYLMGGRAAEKLVFDQLTTGAGNDIERATDLARKMVCSWGMTDALGPLTFGKSREEIFIGREIAQHRDYSEKTSQAIDDEIRRIVERAYNNAEEILQGNLDKLHMLATALLDHEILDSDEIDRIMRGEKLDKIPVNLRTA